MSEAGQSRPETGGGFGPALAQARAQAGLSVEQAAARLRLQPRQVRALEQEDLSALPAAAYVAGFVRNYARELKIDSEPLVEDLNAKLRARGLSAPAADLGGAATVQLGVLDERGWRHVVLAGIVMMLVCAGLIGFWMAHSGIHLGELTAARHPPKPPQPSAAVIAEAEQRNAAPASADIEAPAGRAAPVPGPATPPAASAASAAASASPPASQKSPAAADGADTGSAVAPALTPGLVLRFNDRSWVEVSQSDGRVLLSRNGEPGSIELLNSAKPLVLTVGRADAVQVEYRGRRVDLKPYVSVNGVARLTLADGRASAMEPNSR